MTGGWLRIHAKEAPDRIRELEQWGAVFDRTPLDLPVRELRRTHLPKACSHWRRYWIRANSNSTTKGDPHGNGCIHGVYSQKAIPTDR